MSGDDSDTSEVVKEKAKANKRPRSGSMARKGVSVERKLQQWQSVAQAKVTNGKYCILFIV